jgi:hypothetical protein
MGGIHGDDEIPHMLVMQKDLMIKGKWTYDSDDVISLIKMVEIGLLKLGKQGAQKVVGRFALGDWVIVFRHAAENAHGEGTAIIVPWQCRDVDLEEDKIVPKEEEH